MALNYQHLALVASLPVTRVGHKAGNRKTIRYPGNTMQRHVCHLGWTLLVALPSTAQAQSRGNQPITDGHGGLH